MFSDENKEIFLDTCTAGTIEMPEDNFNEFLGSPMQRRDSNGDELFGNEQDVFMEQVLENLNSTPVGKVLKRIASLPEMRQKKVLDVRERLGSGHYELNERLDIALDKVLEDFIQ